MTVSELLQALESHMPEHGDWEIVLDVDTELCDSDRNILDIGEVGNFHPEEKMLFLNAVQYVGNPSQGDSNA